MEKALDNAVASLNCLEEYRQTLALLKTQLVTFDAESANESTNKIKEIASQAKLHCDEMANIVISFHPTLAFKDALVAMHAESPELKDLSDKISCSVKEIKQLTIDVKTTSERAREFLEKNIPLQKSSQ